MPPIPKPSDRPHAEAPRPLFVEQDVPGGELAASHLRDHLRRDEPNAVEFASPKKPRVEAGDTLGCAVAVHRRNFGHAPGFAVHDRQVEQARRVREREASYLTVTDRELAFEVDRADELIHPKTNMEVERPGRSHLFAAVVTVLASRIAT